MGSLASLDISRFAHAAGTDGIRLGLIGCGGRGSGAVSNALKAGKDVRLVAMADLFMEKINQSLSAITKPANSSQIEVPPARRFVGFNAFQELLASGVDGVMLTTPPGFRPAHFQAAVSAGVHCFLEKPVAVDAPGVRQVRLSANSARQRGLSAIVGLQERYDNSFRQCLSAISDGAIGKITRMRATIHLDDLPRYTQRAVLESQLGRTLTEMEFQLRNWYPFVWLSGDMIVEMLVHHLDDCVSAMGKPPQQARGKAERRKHTAAEYGDLSDFLSATYTYPDGTELQAEISGLSGSDRQWQATIEGEKGIATLPNKILDRQGLGIWSFSGPKNNPYDEEMNQWCASIRNRKALNTVDSAADSTLVAIMGRTAAYTGREITWKEILASQDVFFPHNPKSYQEDPPFLPDKFGDYEYPARGAKA
jgi:myo-inositol 2-dehydrogenase/D-chiro-inositol 1-dehydrogenase